MPNIYAKKFDITTDMKIATGGSCFAQHIGRRLKLSGYNFLDAEPPPEWLPLELQSAYGFSMYSARYGNIYTVHQLAQLAREVAERTTLKSTVWRNQDRFFDALRPAIEPQGFASENELKRDRSFHITKVRKLFSTMDLFVFTLGLTEGWRNKSNGTTYPIAPGVYAGQFDPEEYEFVNYRFGDISDAFSDFLASLAMIREGRALPKILLTVSPIPLTATASGHHVLQASTYSKSVLRAFASDVAANSADISYFPSYEIITNPATRGMYYENNFREVRKEGVDAVMRAFFAAHSDLSRNISASDLDPACNSHVASTGQNQCEEAVLEAFS